MAMAEAEEKPGTEERILTAANTSSLLIDPARGSQADVILAAGLNRNQLGHALIHLRAAWDKADKPPKRSAADIAKRAAEIPDKKGRPDIRRAQIEALVWHAAAMRELAAGLTGRNLVLGLLKEWAIYYGVETDLLSPALFHWLSPKCPVCNGLGKHRMPDAPALSKKACNHCNGAGTWPKPLGADRVHGHIKSCIGRAIDDTGRALHG